MRYRIAHSSSKGYTLFVGMILLAILSTIGISVMKDTLLEEKMSFNFQDKHTAFQAAESALVFIAKDTMRTKNVDSIEAESGFVAQVSISSPLNWDSASSVPLKSNGMSTLASDPKAKIEFIHAVKSKTTGQNPEVNQEVDLRYYRVTARAAGLTDSAVVITQNVLER